PGGAYLHSGVDHVYVAQILAEEKRRNRKGLEEWVQVKRDNHLLDCECMAMACADPEWPGGGVHLVRGRSKREAPEPEPSNREGVRSDWLKPKQNSWFSRGR
ncbi:MAG: phage terminase large subunit family protein, partial [Deltaproteobacteria bacterium]|nr:phage terminase large subunit family protein [Deltaproteobacteria bacterium]